MLRALHIRSIFTALRIDERHIALILLRLQINDFKNPLRAGKRRKHGIEELGNLRNRLGEGARILQKRRDCAKVKLTADHHHCSHAGG